MPSLIQLHKRRCVLTIALFVASVQCDVQAGLVLIRLIQLDSNDDRTSNFRL